MKYLNLYRFNFCPLSRGWLNIPRTRIKQMTIWWARQIESMTRIEIFRKGKKARSVIPFVFYWNLCASPAIQMVFKITRVMKLTDQNMAHLTDHHNERTPKKKIIARCDGGGITDWLDSFEANILSAFSEDVVAAFFVRSAVFVDLTFRRARFEQKLGILLHE